MKHVMIWLVRLYRKYISPLKPPCCRFTPTCSAYAIEAFEKRGFFIGFILTVWRILRCNPFSKGGYDPVPERGLFNPKLRVPNVRDIPEECDSVYTKAHLKNEGIDTACGENVSGEDSPSV